MESKTKIFGHAIHPILIVFPLGLLIAAIIFDVLYFLTDNPSLATVGFWNIAAGIIGGLIAAIFGLWDWLAIPQGTRARSIGLWHGAGNVVVLFLFTMTWLFRWDDPAHIPSILDLMAELLGVVLAAVTGWLGGELVERLGVGVDPGAHLNAPNSLSDRPASETEAGFQGEFAEHHRMRS